jgi:hypothetical protein
VYAPISNPWEEEQDKSMFMTLGWVFLNRLISEEALG